MQTADNLIAAAMKSDDIWTVQLDGTQIDAMPLSEAKDALVEFRAENPKSVVKLAIWHAPVESTIAIEGGSESLNPADMAEAAA
jgi:hypothetical protein